MKNKQKPLKIRGKKQINALEALKPKELEVIKDNKSDGNENPLKYKEIFEELSNKRINEIQNMGKEIDFNKLIYYFTTLNLAPINFVRFKVPIHIYNDIKKVMQH